MNICISVFVCMCSAQGVVSDQARLHNNEAESHNAYYNASPAEQGEPDRLGHATRDIKSHGAHSSTC